MNLELIAHRCPPGWRASTVGQELTVCNDLRLPLSEIQRENMQGEYPYFGPTGELDRINEFRAEGEHALIGEDGDHFLKFCERPMTLLVNGRFNVNNHAHLVKGTTNCSTRWFYYFFMHVPLTPFLTRQGVGRYKLTKAALEGLPILVPPFSEQVIITRILGSWDFGINTLKQMLQGKSRQKRGLMQQLLTGRKRFNEFVKTAQQVRTRYGCFPADWSAAHIGNIANEVSEKNVGGKEYPVLSCTKHRGLVNSLEYFGKRIFSADTSSCKVVRRGDFAYATNHIEEGSIGYQDLHDAALISPMYTVFRTRAGVDHSFFFKLVKTELYRHIFEVNTSGSIARRGGLRWEEFALIKVFLPSMLEQKRIAAVLNTGDMEIELLQKQLEALKEQKRGLMQKLLTGEIRVKVESEQMKRKESR